MKRTVSFIAILSAVLAGCSNPSEATPTEAERREAFCTAFGRLTPGTLEVGEALAILSDPSSTVKEKAQASKDNLDALVRETPYDCDAPGDKALFERFVNDRTSNDED